MKKEELTIQDVSKNPNRFYDFTKRLSNRSACYED